jgi:metal-responsive CopG/Arc/MetJ family transcriptional regulator
VWQSVPSPEKVPVPYERIMVKLPAGLHEEIAGLLTRERRWPSRQDFIIDAVREKLDRLRGSTDSAGAKRKG